MLIPTADNDGREIEPGVIVEITHALDRQFGGFRIIGQNKGSWKGQEEVMIEVEVGVAEGRVAELRAVVRAIGRRLGQKVMYFDTRPPTLELLDVENNPQLNLFKVHSDD